MLAASAVMPRVERSEDRVACEHAGHDVDYRHTVLHRRAIGLATYAHEPRLRLKDEIVAGKRRLGSGRAVTGDRTTDNARRVRFQPIIAEAPLLERAELEVFDQHVASGNELCEHLLPGLGRHVERDGTFVTVHTKEVSRFTCSKGRTPR